MSRRSIIIAFEQFLQEHQAVAQLDPQHVEDGRKAYKCWSTNPAFASFQQAPVEVAVLHFTSNKWKAERREAFIQGFREAKAAA